MPTDPRMTPTNDAPVTDDDGPCTTCDDTGITIQTERPCSCEAGDQYRVKGGAPVTVEQCDRDLYALIAPDMCALILGGELDQHRELQAIARHRLAALASAPAGDGAFQMGDPVEKISGSSWRGNVVGTYSTALTPEGYAVESDTEVGSVQIYPAKALRLARPRATVGERNHLIEIVTEAIHDHAADNAGTARDHATHAVTRILALQSPPAKVEG